MSADGRVVLVDYDPRWPEMFAREAARIRQTLGERVIQIEHAGSTSVPRLAAKPVIDIVLAVAESSDEESYGPSLVAAGYVLRVREPEWFEHRMFKGSDPEVNLHVFSAGCPEIGRMLAFRDWLRGNPADRDLYVRTKISLAAQQWQTVQEYADAKTAVVGEIMARALASRPPNNRD